MREGTPDAEGGFDMAQLSFDNYSILGDIATIALCVVIIILLLTSYVSRTRGFHIFTNIIGSIVIAAVVNILYHGLLVRNDPRLYVPIYLLRLFYQMLLFDVFFLFALYTTEVSGMEHRKARLVAVVSMLLFIVIIGADVVRTIAGVGFRILPDGTVVNRTNIFMIGYIAFVVLLAVLMRRVQRLVYKRVMYGFYGTMIVSVAIRFGQLALNQSSLTTMTFVFPAIAMLYIMHSNPYNVTLGSVDIRAMEDMVRNMYNRKRPFLFMSLQLPEYDEEGKVIPEKIRAVIRRFASDFFHGCVLFQISNGHMILVAQKHANPDYERKIEQIMAAFYEQHERFRLPYKIVIGESIDEISRKTNTPA